MALKKLFEDAKNEAIEEVNLQLAKLREVKQLGKLFFFYKITFI
jgi:hypothetical protein